MSLPLATLKELQKLSALKGKGVILERQYEMIKKHVTEGNSLTCENWEAFDLAWELRSSGVFSEEASAALGVSRAGRERRPNVTLVDQDG